MAVIQNTYTGDGTTVLFSFTFPYIQPADIRVSIDGTDTTAYSLANATTIEFNTAPSSGAAIRIYRSTDADDPLATFYSGSAIRSQDLNDNFTQSLYVIQETVFKADEAITNSEQALQQQPLEDGIKGEISVSNNGANWSIVSGTVTPEKLSSGGPEWDTEGVVTSTAYQLDNPAIFTVPECPAGEVFTGSSTYTTPSTSTWEPVGTIQQPNGQNISKAGWIGAPTQSEYTHEGVTYTDAAAYFLASTGRRALYYVEGNSYFEADPNISRILSPCSGGGTPTEGTVRQYYTYANGTNTGYGTIPAELLPGFFTFGPPSGYGPGAYRNLLYYQDGNPEPWNRGSLEWPDPVFTSEEFIGVTCPIGETFNYQGSLYEQNSGQLVAGYYYQGLESFYSPNTHTVVPDLWDINRVGGTWAGFWEFIPKYLPGNCVIRKVVWDGDFTVGAISSWPEILRVYANWDHTKQFWDQYGAQLYNGKAGQAALPGFLSNLVVSYTSRPVDTLSVLNRPVRYYITLAFEGNSATLVPYPGESWTSLQTGYYAFIPWHLPGNTLIYPVSPFDTNTPSSTPIKIPAIESEVQKFWDDYAKYDLPVELPSSGEVVSTYDSTRMVTETKFVVDNYVSGKQLYLPFSPTFSGKVSKSVTGTTTAKLTNRAILRYKLLNGGGNPYGLWIDLSENSYDVVRTWTKGIKKIEPIQATMHTDPVLDDHAVAGNSTKHQRYLVTFLDDTTEEVAPSVSFGWDFGRVYGVIWYTHFELDTDDPNFEIVDSGPNWNYEPGDTIKLSEQFNDVSYTPTLSLSLSCSGGGQPAIPLGTDPVLISTETNDQLVFSLDNTEKLRLGGEATSLYFDGDLDTRIYHPADNTLVLQTEGVDRLRLDNTGVTIDGSVILTEADKGIADGVVPLNSNVKIDAIYLPSYVDDVLEYATFGDFPATGETGKIYVDLSTNITYRWSGSAYIEVSPMPTSTDAVPEGTTNLYYTDARASAAAPVQSVAGRTGSVVLTKSDITDFADGDYATAAQGLLADTAIQPGDADVITSAMIVPGAIVDTDVNANAAIAGSKISPDFGSQNVTTTGTVTGASLIPSSSTVPTNGVYLPAANTVGVATNGQGRLRVTSGGQVLLESSNSFIGVNTEDGADTSTLLVGGGGAASNTRGAYVWMKGNENADPGALVLSAGNVGTAPITAVTGGSERLRITSAGLVGIGTSSPDSTLNVRAGANNTTAEEIASFSRPDAAVRAAITKGLISGTTNGIALGTTTNHPFALNTNGSERLYITNGGNVGVGTTSPGNALSVVGYGNATSGWSVGNEDGGTSGYLVSTGSTSNSIELAADPTNVGANSNLTFSVDGSERARITSAGLVGIGTSSPLGICHASTSSSSVYSSANMLATTSTLRASNTNTTAGVDSGITFEATGDGAQPAQGAIRLVHTGSGAGALTLGTKRGGTSSVIEAVRIDSAGRVGIGTSAPTNTLHAYNATADVIAVIESGDSISRLLLKDSGGSNYISTVGTNLDFATNGVTSKMRITGAGNVGIGATTVDELLHLESSSANVRVKVESTGANSYPGIRLTNDARTYDIQIDGATDNLRVYDATATSQRLAIDSSGRLLVGTSSAPDSEARALAQIVSGSGPKLVLGNSTSGTYASGATAGEITFIHNSGGTYGRVARIEGLSDGTTSSGTSKPGRLVFSTTADGASSPTARMTIKEDGVVAVGAGDAPNGETLFASAPTGAVAAGAYRVAPTTGTYSAVVFYDGANTDCGSIDIDTTANTTAYTTSSDYRLKTDVQPLTGSLQRLAQLKPCKWEWLSAPGVTGEGFIAHEAQAVVPESVTGEKDAVDDDGNPVYQGIDQSKLVPLLTAALQEAIAKIEVLEQRLNDAGIN